MARSHHTPAQREKRGLFGLLCKPVADFIQQCVFLPINLTAGVIVVAPGFISPSFEFSQGALAFQLIRKSRSKTCRLFCFFDLLIEIIKFGSEGRSTILRPAVIFLRCSQALGYLRKSKERILFSPATRLRYAGVTWEKDKRCAYGRCSLWFLWKNIHVR